MSKVQWHTPQRFHARVGEYDLFVKYYDARLGDNLRWWWAVYGNHGKEMLANGGEESAELAKQKAEAFLSTLPEPTTDVNPDAI